MFKDSMIHETTAKTFAIRINAPFKFASYAIVEVERIEDVRKDVVSALRAEFGPIASIRIGAYPIDITGVEQLSEDFAPCRKSSWCKIAKQITVI